MLGLSSTEGFCTSNCFYAYRTDDAKFLELSSIFFLFGQDVARPQFADGGSGFHIRRISENMWNKQSRKADKGWLTREELE